MAHPFRYALFSDLDRTLLPNGNAPESPHARDHLHALARQRELLLAYVSGRHEQLLRAAIDDWHLPLPAYAVGDVGTSIYRVEGGNWRLWLPWRECIARDWDGAGHRDLQRLYADIDLLTLQEPEKQNEFKLSYYAPAVCDYRSVIKEMRSRLPAASMNCTFIWSVDEQLSRGLLDVLPASATKLHAVEYLMAQHDISDANAVFAGDSGNDLPVVTSGRINSVLVRNAQAEVVTEARRELRKRDAAHRLYVAQGGFLGMNGNYSAGVVEGLVHFLPQCAVWLEH